MLFSSTVFLFAFLPVTLLVYYVIQPRLRNYFLLFMSLLFYAWGEPRFVLIMIGSIIANYGFGLLVNRYRNNRKAARGVLAASVVFNLGLLFIFKYLDFAIRNINNIIGLEIPLQSIALPIGISFFTFQAMSYVIDIYRGDVKVQKNPFYVGLYISFFPQLIAGPIVRYQTIENQILQRTVTFDSFSQGVKRFIIGLGKKVLLANSFSYIADQAFGTDPSGGLSVGFAWLGALAYTFQIFFDFSGYSDMAIGLGKMFGFEFLENFNYPYISKSVSEFWRRWHISLGTWFRDYVYFPLGGSRVERRPRLVLNLFIVWGLTGVWHGASWNFVAWGLLYFVLLAFEKLTGLPKNFKSAAMRGLYRAFTLLCVVGGWVLFRAEGLRHALEYIKSMLGLSGNTLWDGLASLYLNEIWMFLILAVLFSMPVAKVLSQRIRQKSELVQNGAHVLSYLACLAIMIVSVSYLVVGAHNPFIYFNF
jgi:alginate O-acetyltransferase complex protein AlgI